MKRTVTFYLIIYILLQIQLITGQNTNTLDNTNLNSVEDIKLFLEENTEYTKRCLLDNITGDVVLSFTTNTQGQFNDVFVVNSPNSYLSTSSINGFHNLQQSWHNFENISLKPNKQYLIIYRFRRYLDEHPPKYKEQAAKYFSKQKYEKALKFYDKAIQENMFDYELFIARSELKRILRKEKEALIDIQTAERIEDEILTVINVFAILKSGTITTTTNINPY